MVLLPGQKIVTKQQAILYGSSNIEQTVTKATCLRKLCRVIRGQKSLLNVQLKNDTSSVGYVGLQLMKGKIIVIDNTIKETRDMIVKENYILAHTSNV